MTMQTLRLTATGTTATKALAFNARVCFRKLVTILAVRLLGICRGDGVATKDIDAHCDSLKVARIDASSVPTEVVNCQPVRDRAVSQFVSEPMGRDSLPIASTKSETYVLPMLPTFVAYPSPASSKLRTMLREGAILPYHTPKPLGGPRAWATGALSEAIGITSTAHPGVMHCAKAKGMKWFATIKDSTRVCQENLRYYKLDGV